MRKKINKNWRDYMYSFFGILFTPIRWLFSVISDFIYGVTCKIANKKTKTQLNHKSKNNTFLSKKKRNVIFAWIVLAFPIVQFMVFYVGVNLESILLAFQRYDINLKTYVLLENPFANFHQFIADVTTDQNIIKYLGNSIAIYFLGIATMPVTLFFSFYIAKKLRFSGGFSVVLFMPKVISSVVMVIMYKYMLEYTIPTMLETFFGIEKGVSYLLREEMAFWLVWFFGWWSGFGTDILIYTSTMSRVPEQLVESARLDGITLFQEFIYIYFPLIFPTVATFLMLGIGKFLMTGNSAFLFYEADAPMAARTLNYYFYTMVVGSNAGFANYPYASAASLIITFISVPVALVARYLCNKFVPTVEY